MQSNYVTVSSLTLGVCVCLCVFCAMKFPHNIFMRTEISSVKVFSVVFAV